MSSPEDAEPVPIQRLKAIPGAAHPGAKQVYLGVDVAALARMIEKSHPRERDAKIPGEAT